MAKNEKKLSKAAQALVETSTLAAAGENIKEAAAPSRSRAGDKVTVMCKHPHGILMRLFEMVEGSEMVLGGGSRTIKVAEQRGDTVRINGTALPFGKIPDFLIVGGYALTSGIDAEFFAAWMDQNKDHPMVKNKLIMAMKDDTDARAASKEFAATRSGLEPLIPDTDPRIPRRVKTADEQKQMLQQA